MFDAKKGYAANADRHVRYLRCFGGDAAVNPRGPCVLCELCASVAIND